MRPCTLFTGQWADLPFESVAQKARAMGYDGLELACWGDHFDVSKALQEDGYVESRWRVLAQHDLKCFAISNHLVGQAVCDRIDARHQGILPDHIWGDGNPLGVNQRAAEEMANTARAARRFFDADPDGFDHRRVVNGFTGSSIWPILYSFPPNLPGQIEAGYADFARKWRPILDVFDQVDVDFALEVHPTEIAFDMPTTRLALAAIDEHKRFGFNFDPSHFAYQGVDYLRFLEEFADRIFHVHIKDVWWSDKPHQSGTFGGHIEFGEAGRQWDFRSPGRGRVDFESIYRSLIFGGYKGPLSVEWEDAMMDREHGAAEARKFVERLQFPRSDRTFYGPAE